MSEYVHVIDGHRLASYTCDVCLAPIGDPDTAVAAWGVDNHLHHAPARVHHVHRIDCLDLFLASLPPRHRLEVADMLPHMRAVLDRLARPNPALLDS